jgi:hypothetical protein
VLLPTVLGVQRCVKKNGIDILRVTKLILSVLVLSLGWSTTANAAFFGLPIAVKAPLMELSMPINYRDSCPLEKLDLFVLPITLLPQFDPIPSGETSSDDQYFVEI